MPTIKQFSENGPVGVLKPCCTNLSVTPGRPACPSRASGWSSLATPRGFPCCVRFPCVHAAATTPAQRLGVFLLPHPAVSAFPERVVGSALLPAALAASAGTASVAQRRASNRRPTIGCPRSIQGAHESANAVSETIQKEDR